MADEIVAAVASPELRALFGFLASPSTTRRIEAFIAARCAEFARQPEGFSLSRSEHPLAWGHAHREYVELVGALLDGFCAERGLDERALYAQARAAKRADGDGGGGGGGAPDPVAAALLDTFLATFEYEAFLGIMLTYAAMRGADFDAGDAKGGGDDAKGADDDAKGGGGGGAEGAASARSAAEAKRASDADDRPSEKK